LSENQVLASIQLRSFISSSNRSWLLWA